MKWDAVEKLMREASIPCEVNKRIDTAETREKVFPGAVLLVGRGGDILYHEAFGCRSLSPEITPLKKDMVYDVASLTKPLVTTTIAMAMVDSGFLELDQKVSRLFQTFVTQGKEKMAIRHLLAHCSGFPAHEKFYLSVMKADKTSRAGILKSRGAVEFVYNEIYRTQLENPPGKVATYSDLNFILLAHALEVVSGGNTLDKLALKHVIKPLTLRSFGYIDLSKLKRRGLAPVTDIIVPSGYCAAREREICGEVHDENAWAMGGIAGHAGLFASALDIHDVTKELICCYHGKGKLISRDTVRRFWRKDETVPSSTWALGWDTPSSQKSSAGKYFSEQAVGHLGFTGCSVWLEPELELEVILLSNRVHLGNDNERIKEFRPQIHDAIREALRLTPV
jgi:serine-type D-Ala-D-Ala carboxypeptidase